MAKRMAEQMELFEPVERGFDEGGLMDEGGMVDEESGNEVPPGSLREEVRDDIPAQLSEGEFVFPADVVRYIGLENLMRMRQEAKQGLAQMEAMGQMGNGDEATMPDDLPFDMYDLDVDDEEEYNSDELKMQQGGMVPSYDPRTGTYSMPGTGMGGFQPAQQVPTTGYTPYGGIQPYTQPVQYTGTQYTTAEQTTNLPTFGSMIGSGYQGSELRTYVNDAGQVLQIPFVDGKPVYPIPDGYKLQSDQPKKEEQPVTTLSGPTTTTQGDDKGENMTDVTTPSTSVGTTTSTTPVGQTGRVQSPFQGFDSNTNAYGGNAEFGFSNKNYREAVAKQGSYQVASIGLLGIATEAGKGFGLTDYSMNDMAVAGHSGKTDALAHMGMINADQMMSNAQADLVAEAINAAHAAQEANEDVDEAISGVLNSARAKQIEEEAYQGMKQGYANYLDSLYGPNSTTSNSANLPQSMRNGGTLSDRDYAKAMEDVEKEAKATLEDIEQGKKVNGYKTRVMSRNVKTGLLEPVKNAYTKQGSYYKSLAEKKQKLAALQREKAARAEARAAAKRAADIREAQGGTRDSGKDDTGGFGGDAATGSAGRTGGSGSAGPGGGPGGTSAGEGGAQSEGGQL